MLLVEEVAKKVKEEEVLVYHASREAKKEAKDVISIGIRKLPKALKAFHVRRRASGNVEAQGDAEGLEDGDPDIGDEELDRTLLDDNDQTQMD